NVPPPSGVRVAEGVKGMILEIDEERRRISLGMKQCKPNPWEDFAREYKKGDKVKGQIKSITDFGVFVGRPGGIDGLVHLSDLSWSSAGEEAVKNFKKSEEVEAVVLSIDVERERISLGVKQLEGDPFTNFIASHEKNSVVSGPVKSAAAKAAQTAGRCCGRSWTRATRRSSKAGSQGKRDAMDGGRVAMTKSELIARLAQRYPQLVAKDAEYAVKMILDAR